MLRQYSRYAMAVYGASDSKKRRERLCAPQGGHLPLRERKDERKSERERKSKRERAKERTREKK